MQNKKPQSQANDLAKLYNITNSEAAYLFNVGQRLKTEENKKLYQKLNFFAPTDALNDQLKIMRHHAALLRIIDATEPADIKKLEKDLDIAESSINTFQNFFKEASVETNKENIREARDKLNMPGLLKIYQRKITLSEKPPKNSRRFRV
jgi:hypothetical protein